MISRFKVQVSWLARPDLDKISNLNATHPLLKDDYISLEIDYKSLKNDYPDTKIFGLELIPYKDS